MEVGLPSVPRYDLACSSHMFEHRIVQRRVGLLGAHLSVDTCQDEPR